MNSPRVSRRLCSPIYGKAMAREFGRRHPMLRFSLQRQTGVTSCDLHAILGTFGYNLIYQDESVEIASCSVGADTPAKWHKGRMTRTAVLPVLVPNATDQHIIYAGSCRHAQLKG